MLRLVTTPFFATTFQVIDENMLRTNIAAADCMPMTVDRLEEIRVRHCMSVDARLVASGVKAKTQHA